MAINAKNYKQAQELYSRLQTNVSSLAPDTFMYQRESEKLNRLRRSMDEYETSQRKTDEAGKLVSAPATTRAPSAVGEPPKDKPHNFHFEPSVGEVQQLLRQDPSVADRLGLREWTTGVASPEKVEQVTDPMTGMVSGQTVAPARTHLDNLTEGDSAYKAVAEEIWERRRQEAEARGEPVQRYRDVKLGDQPLQYLTGGLEYNIDRRLAPATLGVADSLSMGQASPLYDAVRDVADYHQGRPATPEHTAPVADPMTGMPVGENTVPESRPAQYELPPSSQGVIGRSPGSYLAGNIAGYGLKFNPVNLATEGAVKAAGYAGRGALGKLGVSAGVGAVGNTVEGAVGDFSRALGQGQSIGDAASTAASNAPLNFAVGGVGGGLFDAAGQALGAGREAYRNQERLSGLKVLEEAGGQTHPWRGVQAPPEVQQAFDASKQRGAVGTAGAVLADELAPSIEGSLTKQAADEQARIQQQMQEYFTHPTYGSIEVGSRPLLETLLNLASPGRFRGPLTGEARHIDPRKLQTIGKEFTNLAEVRYVPEAEASAFTHETGGVPIDHELAAQFYGDTEFSPGTVPIAVPRPLTAQLLTEMEERIYRELGISNRSAGNDDPVYRQLDRATKQMRDQFPYYTDEAGNLVEPPPTPSQAPFAPAADLPPAGPDRPTVLPRPSVVDAPSGPRPEAQPGVGPVDIPLPRNPFDRSPLMPRAGYADAHQPPMAPQARVDVTGGERARPDPIPPEAYPGIGQPRRARGVSAIEPQPTKAVTGGEYDRPPPVEPDPEPVPDTLRNMGPRRPDELEPPYLDESQPAPTAAEWTDSTDEAAQWTDGILQPGAPARSSEAKRMTDLMEQMTGDSEAKAFEEAKSMVDNVDKRLGPLEPAQRETMLMDVLRERLGREVTREDLIKAGLITGAGVAAVTAEDDETGVAAAAVAGLAGDPMKLGAKAKAKTPFARQLLAYNSSDKAVEVLDDLGSYLSVNSLKKDKVLNAAIDIVSSSGLDKAEVDDLIITLRDLSKAPPTPQPASKPAPKAYVSEIDHTPDSSPREIGSSLRLGPRFRGDAEDARELIKKTKKELPPPPKEPVPYQSDPTHARGYDVSKPSKALNELGSTSLRKYRELDGAEKYAVDTWMGNSRVMREEQRNGIPLYTTGPKAPAFEEAIDKLTVTNPTKHGNLYRRFYAEERELAELLSNDYFEAGAHMSSSYYPNGTFGPHELRFKKVDQAGSLLGANASEAEMVIPKGGRFRVLNRYYNPETRGYVFELEEIPLTQENLLKEVGYLAVPIAAGAAADELTDGDGEAVAAGAMIGAGGKRPKQLEALLDDGTTVKGFSALRRGQHTEQEAIERAKRRVGATGEETLPRRIQNFNQTKEGVRQDKALLEEARKIGKEKELRSAAAANVYPELNDMKTPLGGNQGVFKSVTDALMLRLDKPLEFMSGRFGPGQERNPFARAPGSLGEEMQQRYLSEPARRLMNLTGGRGFRYSDSIYDQYEEEDRKQRQKESRR